MPQGLTTILRPVTVLGALICFFAAPKYRTDNGGQAPPFGAVKPSRLRAFSRPRGFQIALAGGICFTFCFVLTIISYSLK